MEELEQIWLEHLGNLDIAFQPIVSMHSGALYGVEALIRGVERIGFPSIMALFDQAYFDNVLYTFDIALREKIIKKFIQIPNSSNIKLFINLDNRLLEMDNFSNGNTAKLLEKYGLHKEMICFEISERHEIAEPELFEQILDHYKKDHYSIAIDDFGVGFSGYKLLYQSTPDIIKIDRFFLDSIGEDMKKRILVRSIVQLATQLGITVIAEGVETDGEYLVSKELGCHLLQGYLVQRPSLDIHDMCHEYKHIHKLSLGERRSPSNKKQIKAYMEKIPPLYVQDRMSMVLERFKARHDHMALPVLGRDHTPLGVLDEEAVRALVTSPYGRSILLNESSKNPKVKKYIRKCAMVDIHASMEQMVEAFASYKGGGDGIIITKNMQYYGFLSASSIIAIMNDRNLASARDQNPLTKMPGNMQIDSYIKEVVDAEENVLFVYFDLNHFKAYNDSYGFRNGDRVIQMFADILKMDLPKTFFKGHIGGDDFFVATKLGESNYSSIVASIQQVAGKFTDEVRHLYDQHDRDVGYIMAKDRDGHMKRFDLLGVSCVVVQVHPKSRRRALDLIHKHFALQKRVAKSSEGYMNCSTIL